MCSIAATPGSYSSGSMCRRCSAPLKSLVGKHDFASFETAGSERETTERTVFDLRFAGENESSITSAQNRICEPRAVLHPIARSHRPAKGAFDSQRQDCANRSRRRWLPVQHGAQHRRHLVEVGQGKQPESWVAEVLAARDRRRAGRPRRRRAVVQCISVQRMLLNVIVKPCITADTATLAVPAASAAIVGCDASK